MGWSTGYESQRGNLTSLLGTLAQMKEGKKNRRSQLLSDLLGIGAGFGGALLQNKFAKQAEERQRPYDLAKQKYEQEQLGERQQRDIWAGQQQQALGFGYNKQLQQLADAAAKERALIGTGEKDKDKEKITAYQVASTIYERELNNFPELMAAENRNKAQYDRLVNLMVTEGESQGINPEVMRGMAESYLRANFQLPPEPGTEQTAFSRKEQRAEEKRLTDTMNALTKQVQELAKAKGQENTAKVAIQAAYSRPMGRPVQSIGVQQLNQRIAALQKVIEQLQVAPPAGTQMAGRKAKELLRAGF